ncbi:hypothetical protein Achl_4352 (plasmid) [Pseudarthrobacter chlorophenolicus A6]|uniref:Uncharacterized protein n=1 Tax=Pseudarthrobacter chlorophenolicus (strain ATCC 700700 / DSM 12829 / CIP 107037 / JCM 12360 / KCTC 9906 / NCIMB 13794 / A6) TaxID=452863 RepID=B8HIQ6_PSECP|nr:hypothetical protein [Pseudarthrobacter chlorophenolicus]ACL42303.1 hypothetical protein Achl_4352 [Pseudarthrobacter chlorophenolicus A6]SDQ16228.1 hypothetical protein SAMN04489738_0409 [Pseudarthrobacter chlorophenolicus]
METQKLPAFDINHHRYVAQKAKEGRAHQHMLEASQEALLAEVERLTYLISPAKLKQPAIGEQVEASTVVAVIAALAKQPRNAAVLVEYYGSKSHPGEISSYRGYHDELRIGPQGREPKTVADVLKDLRRFRKNGITGYKGGDYPVTDSTGLWVAYYGESSHQHVAGIRVDGGVVVIATEERDW